MKLTNLYSLYFQLPLFNLTYFILDLIKVPCKETEDVLALGSQERWRRAWGLFL